MALNNTFLPSKATSNGTLIDEIQCYSLPNGGIGFASHIITYYTIVMLGLGRRPFMPWKTIKHSVRSIVISVISLIITITVTAITMARCRHRWQLVAICGWKLGLSLTLGFASIFASLKACPAPEEETLAAAATSTTGALPVTQSIPPQPRYAPQRPSWARPEVELQAREPDRLSSLIGTLFCCMILYLPGLIAGVAGLISLVSETIHSNQDVKITTGAFGGAICLFGLITLGETGIFNCAGCDDDDDATYWLLVGMLLSLLIASMPWLGVLGVFYSDWVLAAIAENLTGTPSSDNAALYWSYFFAKRLPLLVS